MKEQLKENTYILSIYCPSSKIDGILAGETVPTGGTVQIMSI